MIKKQNNGDYYVAAALSVAVVAMLVGINTMVRGGEEKLLEGVQSGSKVLQCHMPDGIRPINKNFIVDYVDGVWYFENKGYSKTCEVIDVRG